MVLHLVHRYVCICITVYIQNVSIRHFRYVTLLFGSCNASIQNSRRKQIDGKYFFVELKGKGTVCDWKLVSRKSWGITVFVFYIFIVVFHNVVAYEWKQIRLLGADPRGCKKYTFNSETELTLYFHKFEERKITDIRIHNRPCLTHLIHKLDKEITKIYEIVYRVA